MDDDKVHELEALESILSDPSKEPIKLSYGLLKFITGNFSNEIGCGGFGTVYQGVWENGVVAVKKISNTHDFSDKLFMDEINCLKSANHKNIVRFLGYCADTQEEMMLFNGTYVMAGERNRLLCFEYVPNGNIQQYLQQVRPHGHDWPMCYQMIRGICGGLQHLHDNNINHLDLKPANVMLDAHMKAKITDFGSSRCLDQGQSKIITQNILGTPRYIAPEIIDKGEISLKSDIYSLGIIIIELLTGNNKIDLENWNESLDVDCPRARRCREIARNRTDRDEHNRPTVREIICNLDDLESMIPQSSTKQVTAFPSNELVDLYPLELRFTFVPNQEMHCHLSLTNKQKDCGVYCVIIPEVPNRYWGGFEGFLPPMSTAAIILSREAGEELPSGTDKLEMLVLITGSDEDAFEQQLSTLSLDKYTSCEDTIMAAHELLGFELHRAMLTAVVIISEDDNRSMWGIDDPDPIATTQGLKHYGSSDLFTYTGNRHFIAAMSYQNACIWDLQKGKHVHTLFTAGTKEKIVGAICHPTCPVLVTASGDGSIRVWDSTTYRLKKAYVNIPKKPLHIGFTGSRSLVIGHGEGITVVDIDL